MLHKSYPHNTRTFKGNGTQYPVQPAQKSPSQESNITKMYVSIGLPSQHGYDGVQATRLLHHRLSVHQLGQVFLGDVALGVTEHFLQSVE